MPSQVVNDNIPGYLLSCLESRDRKVISSFTVNGLNEPFHWFELIAKPE